MSFKNNYFIRIAKEIKFTHSFGRIWRTVGHQIFKFEGRSLACALIVKGLRMGGRLRHAHVAGGVEKEGVGLVGPGGLGVGVWVDPFGRGRGFGLFSRPFHFF